MRHFFLCSSLKSPMRTWLIKITHCRGAPSTARILQITPPMVHPLSVQELSRILLSRRDEIIHVIETSTGESYSLDHLPRAIHLEGFFDLQSWIEREHPTRNEIMICYSENANSSLPYQFAHFLNALGFDRAFYFKGGKEEWRAAGLPFESSYGSFRPQELAEILPHPSSLKRTPPNFPAQFGVEPTPQ